MQRALTDVQQLFSGLGFGIAVLNVILKPL